MEQRPSWTKIAELPDGKAAIGFVQLQLRDGQKQLLVQASDGELYFFDESGGVKPVPSCGVSWNG